jgi:copper chaperone
MEDGMTTILTAADMSCNHCKMTIEKAVKGLPGIRSVVADPGTKKVNVDFDETAVSISDIKHTIEEAGYSVAD